MNKGELMKDNIFKTIQDNALYAKKRDHKIDITDVAINKIPRVQFKGFSDMESDILYQLSVLVLWTSLNENNSNEVAITCALDSDKPLEGIGVAYGDEHEVDVCSDTASYHLLVSGSKCVVILHNHPSVQTLSLEDVKFFLHFESIRMIVVVTNQGNIHYLCKDDEYIYENAKDLFNECVEEMDENSTEKEIYTAALTFLARASEVGLYYR